MFMNDISIIVRQMYVFAERRMANYGVGFAEQVVLMFLSSSGPVSQDQIVRSFDIDKGAISKTLAKMESKGLIVRCPDTEDKRVKICSMTPVATDILAEMSVVLAQWHESVFKGLSEEDEKQLNEAMSLLAANSKNLIQESN